MTRLRVATAVVALLIGFSVFALELTRGNWISGLACLLTGFVVAWAVLLGLLDSRDSTFLRIASPVVMLLGIFAVFVEHRAFDLKASKAHIDALYAFTRMQDYCRPMAAKLQALQSEGIKVCTTQENSDQLSALVNLQKAKDLPAGLSLVDGALSALSSPEADQCFDTFESAKALCPEISLAVMAVGSNVPR